MNVIENLFTGLGAMIYDFLIWLTLPDWLAAVILLFLKWLLIILVVIVDVIILIWLERKISGYIQQRLGPNRLGPGGCFQTIADTLKLRGKEDIIPRPADKVLFVIAPAMFIIVAVMLYAVVPMGKDMMIVDFDLSMLFFISVASLGTLALFMGGWGSDNKWSLMGAMRAVAQMISYEVPLAFSLLGVVMITGSLQFSEIVAAQENIWFVFLQPIAFVTYFIAATAELNRGPFDMPEAEQELTAGPYTEYTGMRWALFFLAEYTNLVAVCLMCSAVFFGGWHGPAFLPSWAWMFIKAYFFILVFFWIKWTLPRIRMDKLMEFSWKFLVPVSLGNVLLTGVGLMLFR